MKIVLIIFFLTYAINANFIDSDLDGVEDSKDLCPNSDIFDIVDKNGCTVKKLSVKEDNELSYSLSLSYFYSKDEVTQKSYSLNFSIAYKDFSAFIESSQYRNDTDSGIDDTTVALFYTYKNTLNYTIGIGAYLPTGGDSDNKTDFFAKIKLSYENNNFDTYISYQKTFNRDLNTLNSNSYSLGLGYYFNYDFYSSISFTQSDSIYYKNEKSKYLSIFMNYYLNKHVYISANYSKGLNSNSTKSSYYFTFGYDF